MPTSYTSLLGLALPVTGELSGTWGDTVNDYITQYLDASVAGTQTISGSQTAVTLSKTTATSLSQAGSGATGSSQYMIINCTGNPASMLTITAPAASKPYIVINGTSTNQDVKIVGAGPTTGVTLAASEKAVVAWNGSDFVKVASSVVDGVSTISFGTTGLTPSTATSGAVTVAGTLIAANGGTGLTSPGANGNVLTSNGTAWTSAALPAGGLTYVYKTANYNVSNKEGVLADTSGGAFTVTLPATPATGDQVVVADAGASWGTNNLTVGRNGSTIGGLAENLVCDITGASVQLVYDGSTWEVYAQIGGNGGNAATQPGNNAFTGANTFYNATGQTFGTATSTQDGIILAGRSGGSSSYRVTLQPGTLSASRTVTLPDGGGNYTLGYLNLPAVGTKTGSYTLATADVGKYVQVGSGGSITIPDATFAEGDAISIFNNTTGNITITCTITTAYIAGTNTDKATMTLATRGVATILFYSATACVVSGNVT